MMRSCICERKFHGCSYENLFISVGGEVAWMGYSASTERILALGMAYFETLCWETMGQEP